MREPRTTGVFGPDPLPSEPRVVCRVGHDFRRSVALARLPWCGTACGHEERSGICPGSDAGRV